jgi:hypothetical protein
VTARVAGGDGCARVTAGRGGLEGWLRSVAEQQEDEDQLPLPTRARDKSRCAMNERGRIIAKTYIASGRDPAAFQIPPNLRLSRPPRSAVRPPADNLPPLVAHPLLSQGLRTDPPPHPLQSLHGPYRCRRPAPSPYLVGPHLLRWAGGRST